MKHLRTLLLALALGGLSSSAYAQGSDLYGQGMRLNLNEDGSKYIRFITWVQFWARAQEFNPGTTVAGEAQDWAGDFLIRRARFLTYSQLSDRVLVMFHAGINNQNFRDFRADFYVHDAWVEYKLFNKDVFTLHLGGGLHYWNGISRATNASTLNIMAIDEPITNWPTIELTDQFARQIGLFVHGKIAKRIDYRMSVNRPFNRGAGSPTEGMNSFSVAGYYQLQLWDIEGSKLPYTVGTWLGSKKVLNFGFGFHIHPDALGGAATSNRQDIVILGGDIFLDLPFGEPSRSKTPALTAYFSYQYQDFGDGFVRNIGISNIGDTGSGSSLNGRGNAYPSVGTGHHFYLIAGYLIPLGLFGDEDALQPYADLHLSALDGPGDTSYDIGPTIGAGANYYIHGHHAKITLHYRARPVFVDDPATGERENSLNSLASEVIAQLMLWF